ncbi:MAG: hypothetical protein OXC31_21130 [Spirochaetaceae bacterium]|nr:hypothetical protein [Spirochaetaceae bacterium]
MQRKSLAIALGLLLTAGWAFAEGQTDRLSFTTDEHMTISWGGLTSDLAEEGNAIQEFLEDKFNVTIVTKGVSRSDEEAKQLFMSSGEYPEAFYTWIDMVDWYHKGAFRNIPREMIETYAPLHSAYRNQQGPLAWGVSLAPGTTDEYMNIPRGEHYQHHCDATVIMRLDWLEQIGINPTELDPKAPGWDRAGEFVDLGEPTAPDTFFWWAGHLDWDEMEAAMYGFRDADFNGNGQRDEIPYGTIGDHGGFQGREWLYHSGPAVPFWAYGLNDVDNYLDIETGLTVKVDIASQSREALKILQRWFADGILDPALPAVGRNEWRQQVRAGLVGMWARGPCGLAAFTGGNDDCTIIRADAVPDARFVTTLPAYGPTGEMRCQWDNRSTVLNPHEGFSVKTGVSDEKLARILQMYDYINHDPEGVLAVGYGVGGPFAEDQNYAWLGTPGDCSVAQLVGTPTLERHSNGTSLVYTAYSWHDLFWQCPQMKPGIPIEAAGGATINSAQGFNWAMMLREPYPMEIAVRDHREDIFNRTEYVKLWARYGGNLQTFREETWWKWVTDSSIDIDAEWPGFVEQWLANGGQEVIDELQKAPLVETILNGTLAMPTS